MKMRLDNLIGMALIACASTSGYALAGGMPYVEAVEICDRDEDSTHEVLRCIESAMGRENWAKREASMWANRSDEPSEPEEPKEPSKPLNPSDPSQGSCFFISSNGYVVTNHHVVSGRNEFVVVDGDGVQFSATLVKRDPANDLAVLNVETRNHKYLTMAPFGSLNTGQEVFSVGYPATFVLGTQPKYTDGTVSATTGLQDMANMFQMSVPIQPGNSGGPVLNEKGQVVGVATSSAAVGAFLRNTGTLPQNVNWAIKSEYVSLLAGVEPSKASWGSRQDAIDAAIGASCMVKAQ